MGEAGVVILLHWTHQQCYHLRADKAEEQIERGHAPGVGSVAVDMVVMGTQRRSQLQRIATEEHNYKLFTPIK